MKFAISIAATTAIVSAASVLNSEPLDQSKVASTAAAPITSSSLGQWVHQKGFDFRYFSSDEDNMEVDVIISSPDDGEEKPSETLTIAPRLSEATLLTTSFAEGQNTFTITPTQTSIVGSSQTTDTGGSLIQTASFPRATFSLSYDTIQATTHQSHTPSVITSATGTSSSEAPSSASASSISSDSTSRATSGNSPFGFGYGFPPPYGNPQGFPSPFGYGVGNPSSTDGSQQQPRPQSQAVSSDQRPHQVLPGQVDSNEDSSSSSSSGSKDNGHLSKRGIISDFLGGRSKNKKVTTAINYAPPPIQPQAYVPAPVQVQAYQPCAQQAQVQAIQPRINDVYGISGYYSPQPVPYPAYGYGYGYPPLGNIAGEAADIGGGLFSEAMNCMSTLLNPSTYCPGFGESEGEPYYSPYYYSQPYYQPYYYQQPTTYQQPQLVVSYSPPQQQCYYVTTPSCDSTTLCGYSYPQTEPIQGDQPAPPLVSGSPYASPPASESQPSTSGTSSTQFSGPAPTGINSGDSSDTSNGVIKQQVSERPTPHELLAQAQALLAEQLAKQTASTSPEDKGSVPVQQAPARFQRPPQPLRLSNGVSPKAHLNPSKGAARLNVFPPNERVPVN